MPDSLVSVIVPAYNAAATIRRTLACALAQTHRNIEVVVVDDGSTDRTAAAIERAAAKDPRIRHIRQPNRGVAAARNAGIEAARGAIIAPLDADDIWHPTKIERQLEVLAGGGTEVGLVHCHARLIDADEVIVESWPLGECSGDAYSSLLFSNFIRSSSIPLMRRADIEAVGGYDTSLRARSAQGCEDFKLYLRLAERTRFALCPQFLVGYRFTPSSMSRDSAQMRRSWQLVVNEARARHPDLPPWLFRWSTGNFHRWLGFTALAAGRTSPGMAALWHAFRADPGGSLNREAAVAFAETLAAQVLARVGLKKAAARMVDALAASTRSRTGSRARFMDVDPAAPEEVDMPRWQLKRLRRVRALSRRQACPDQKAVGGGDAAIEVRAQE